MIRWITYKGDLRPGIRSEIRRYRVRSHSRNSPSDCSPVFSRVLWPLNSRSPSKWRIASNGERHLKLRANQGAHSIPIFVLRIDPPIYYQAISLLWFFQMNGKPYSSSLLLQTG